MQGERVANPPDELQDSRALEAEIPKSLKNGKCPGASASPARGAQKPRSSEIVCKINLFYDMLISQEKFVVCHIYYIYIYR